MVGFFSGVIPNIFSYLKDIISPLIIQGVCFRTPASESEHPDGLVQALSLCK